jgi:hypothetical protein
VSNLRRPGAKLNANRLQQVGGERLPVDVAPGPQFRYGVRPAQCRLACGIGAETSR